jgi:hypothetical protein
MLVQDQQMPCHDLSSLFWCQSRPISVQLFGHARVPYTSFYATNVVQFYQSQKMYQSSINKKILLSRFLAWFDKAVGAGGKKRSGSVPMTSGRSFSNWGDKVIIRYQSLA